MGYVITAATKKKKIEIKKPPMRWLFNLLAFIGTKRVLGCFNVTYYLIGE
jgi:hypothetical protein